MSSKLRPVVLASVSAVLLLGAPSLSSADGASPAPACSGAIPAKLAAPAGNALAFELLAEGVQIYSCAATADPAGAPAWTLKAPEATLKDRNGERTGSHGAGPTWEAYDGSSVVGTKVEAVTTDASAIPWLLLRAVSHGGGRGRMADVTFVQRVQTSGGLAPSEGCSAATVGAIVLVPYHAVYCFYRSQGSAPGAERTARAPGVARP